MPKKFPDDITSPSMTNNQTWNDCPGCGKAWRDATPTPGIIHRTRYCDTCKGNMHLEVFGHMYEVKKDDN